ncbi:MAG: hypothetical protein AB1635_11530 [Acidobacteriota bacterium]
MAVESALSAPPPKGYAGIPKGVRLLGISQDAAGPLVLNFSQELIASGTGPPLEDALHRVLTVAADAYDGSSDLEFRVLIEGRPLEEYLR